MLESPSRGAALLVPAPAPFKGAGTVFMVTNLILASEPRVAGQALFLKAQVEGWRANNIFGLLLWQFNEVWPTGGWGARKIDFPS